MISNKTTIKRRQLFEKEKVVFTRNTTKNCLMKADKKQRHPWHKAGITPSRRAQSHACLPEKKITLSSVLGLYFS
jgi:hypothetical protein